MMIPIQHRRDVANLVQAIDRLLEAAAHRRRDKALARLEQRLVKALRRAFKAQERELLKRLAKQRGAFDATEGFRTRRYGGITVREVSKRIPLSGMLEEAAEPDWDALLDEALLATIQGFLGPLEDFIALAIRAGATDVLAVLGITDAFDLPNPKAAGYTETYAAELVKGINATTKAQIRSLITDGIEQGRSYTQIANEIKARFAGFHTPSLLKHIKDRATLIAVQELGDAYEAGNEATVQQLADAGLTMEKAWLTVKDNRVSQEICAANAAQGWIPFDEPFQSGHMRPLGHIGCRCTAQYRRRPNGDD